MQAQNSGENLLRILMVIPGLNAPGSLPTAHDQAEQLSQAGICVKKLVLRAGANPLNLSLDLLNLANCIRCFRPTIIHAQFGTITAFMCLLFFWIPLVVTFRGSDLNPSVGDTAIRNLGQKILSNICALFARGIICVSPGLKDRLWWRRSQAIILPPGIDLSKFSQRPKHLARERLGLNHENHIVLFNAGSTPPKPVKRAALALAAIDFAKQSDPQIEFISLNGTVSRDAVIDFLSAADCLILTSEMEGSPDIVKEALACSLPVVSVDVGDIRSRLASVPLCRVVDACPSSLGTAILEIIAIGERISDPRVCEDFSAVNINHRLIDVYKKILVGKQRESDRQSQDGSPS